jgi:hypothetical protein
MADLITDLRYHWTSEPTTVWKETFLFLDPREYPHSLHNKYCHDLQNIHGFCLTDSCDMYSIPQRNK